MEVRPPPLIRPDSGLPCLRKHKRSHGNTQGPQKNRFAVRKGPQIAYSTRRSLACQLQIPCKLAMQPVDGVRRIHCTTHPVNVYRKTWAGRPQVPETSKQALPVHTPHTCVAPQKLHQCRRIVTKNMCLADAYIKNKFQSPQNRTRLRALLVWRLLRGYCGPRTKLHRKKSQPVHPPPRRAPHQHTQTPAFSAPLSAGESLTNPAKPTHTPRT